jgi:hypothetical protein
VEAVPASSGPCSATFAPSHAVLADSAEIQGCAAKGLVCLRWFAPTRGANEGKVQLLVKRGPWQSRAL